MSLLAFSSPNFERRSTLDPVYSLHISSFGATVWAQYHHARPSLPQASWTTQDLMVVVERMKEMLGKIIAESLECAEALQE